MDEPFDDFAVAAQTKAATRPCHRHHAEIEVRSGGAVDADLGFAAGATLVESGKIHEGKLDRALHFVGMLTGEKNRRGVGVNALYRLAQRVRGRIGEKGKDLLLIAGG